MTKQEAALEQIEAAIAHFHGGQYACAITLAGAAEDQMVVRENSEYVWARLQELRPDERPTKEWVAMFNDTRNWLKHPTPELGDVRDVREFECVVMMLRASSKFYACYSTMSLAMDQFKDWCTANDHYTWSINPDK
jgi:hypothetical protein